MTKRLLTTAAACALLLFSPVSLLAQQAEFGNRDYTTPLVSLTNAGAGTTDSQDQTNQYGKGVALGINISAKSGTIAVTVKIQGKDVVSSQYYDICTTTALTTTGFSTLKVLPGGTAAANLICNDHLPNKWRVEVVSGAGVTPSVTMTVGASILY